jgi:hypothetical protein
MPPSAGRFQPIRVKFGHEDLRRMIAEQPVFPHAESRTEDD